MQSDGISFGGDVVLNLINRTYWNKDRILDKKNMQSKYFGIGIMKNLNFKSDGGKCILKEIQHITTKNKTTSP